MKKAFVKLVLVAVLMAGLIWAIGATNHEGWLSLWFLLFFFAGIPVSLLSLRDFLLSFSRVQTAVSRFWLMLHVCAVFAAGVGYLLGLMAESSEHPKADLHRWLVVVFPSLVYLTPVLLQLHAAPGQLLRSIWGAVRGHNRD